MFSRYQIAFARARKPYHKRLLFTYTNWLFLRDFCNEAKLRRADLLSGESHIG